MKQYTGLVVHLHHSVKELFFQWCEQEYYCESCEEREEDMFAARYEGHHNPVDDIRQFVEDNNLDALVITEETIFHSDTNPNDGGSFGDIFTEYTFSKGILTDVVAEAVSC